MPFHECLFKTQVWCRSGIVAGRRTRLGFLTSGGEEEEERDGLDVCVVEGAMFVVNGAWRLLKCH